MPFPLAAALLPPKALALEAAVEDDPLMQTVTTSSHVLRLAEQLMSERGLPTLTADQAEVVAAAIDRWYGIPLQLPSPADNARFQEGNQQQQ